MVNRKAAHCRNPHVTSLRHGCGGGQTFPDLGNATNMAICNLANTAYMHSHRHGIIDFNANVTTRRFRCNGYTPDINGYMYQLDDEHDCD